MLKPPTVLIAEDVKAVRMKLEQMITTLGLEPVVVSDGQAALTTFADRRPQVVLLDIAMPELDGLEVCRRIRRTSDDVLIVMISADSRPSVVRQAVAAGANDFITKPFDLERLEASLGDVLDAA